MLDFSKFFKRRIDEIESESQVYDDSQFNTCIRANQTHLECRRAIYYSTKNISKDKRDINLLKYINIGVKKGVLTEITKLLDKDGFFSNVEIKTQLTDSINFYGIADLLLKKDIESNQKYNIEPVSIKLVNDLTFSNICNYEIKNDVFVKFLIELYAIIYFLPNVVYSDRKISSGSLFIINKETGESIQQLIDLDDSSLIRSQFLHYLDIVKSQDKFPNRPKHLDATNIMCKKCLWYKACYNFI